MTKAKAPPLVLIGCGARKLDHPGPARDVYVGPYFAACLSTALAITDPGRVLILSARYGLLGVDDPIAPYDLTLGQPGAVTAADVGAQAAAKGIGREPVTALCGKRYADVARQVWPDVAAPLAGLGIGRQRHVLSAIRNRAEGAELR